MLKPETLEHQALKNHKFAQCPKCPARILIVPDLKAMRTAIETHAKMHSDPDEVDRILSERTMISIVWARGVPL